MTYRNLLTTTRELQPRSNRDGKAPALALPPAPELPHIPPMPTPRKSAPGPKSQVSGPSPRPRGPKSIRSASISPSCSIPLWSSPSRRGLAKRRSPDSRPAVPESHPARPDRRRGLGRFAQSAAGRGRPQHPQPAPVAAAPAAAAGQVRGRAGVSRRIRIRAEGRPAAGDRGTGQGRSRPGARPGAARRHRFGQDLHHGQGDRGDPAAGFGPRAQQDAGRAALRRVQELLPRQRGRIFRLLLRLLPARSLRAAHRHLYREGIRHQRADRPHAPLGDAGAARARRRHHRRLRLLHLWHRLGRDLHRDDFFAEAWRQGRPAPARQGSRRAAIQARAGRRFFTRLVPCEGRHDGSFPRPLRGPRLAHRACSATRSS